MIDRILLAADESLAALAATHVAVELALPLGARIRAVRVVQDGPISTAVGAATAAVDVAERREVAAASLLGYVAGIARQAGLVAETVLLDGEPASCILDEATRWRADLIVIGRSGRAGVGEPYVGSETARVLEFAEQPVLVVPHMGSA